MCTDSRIMQTVIKRIKKKFIIIEDNGRGLTLVVFDDNKPDKVSYLHTGYEYILGQLTNDLIELANGADPSTWEGCEENPEEIYNDFKSYDGWEIIADNNGLYPDKMGAAGRLEFGIEKEQKNEERRF